MTIIDALSDFIRFFSPRNAKYYLENGDRHLEHVYDLKRDLDRGELQEAIRDYSKAIDLLIEKQEEGVDVTEMAGHSSPLGYIRYNFRVAISKEYLLTRRALVYFLDGQYDRALEDLDIVSWPLSAEGEQDLLRARVCATMGNYEEALASYSRVIEWTNGKRYRTGYDAIYRHAERERAALLCKLGRQKEAASPMAEGVSYHGPVDYVQDFEKRFPQRSQDDFYVANTQNPVDLIFFIKLKDSDNSPPILNIRKAVDLENATIDIARPLPSEFAPYVHMPTEAFPIPILPGVIFTWRTTYEQASKFIKQIHHRADIEQLECFAGA